MVETAGDRRQDRPVSEIGGQGIFVKEVQAAVLEGRADLAVHSAKDLPSYPAPGLTLAAVPVRADRRDVLIGSRLFDLGPGATVATGSVRRRAQLAWWRPDLTFTGLRGNIATRLARIPSGGAIVMAAAAVERLQLSGHVVDPLETWVMLPQVGQGAIAVECRSDDERVLEHLAVIDDVVAHTELDAERAYLARLGGGCNLPVGAMARLEGGGQMHLEAMLASMDGHISLRAEAEGPVSDRAGLGTRLAERLLDSGGASILDDAGMVVGGPAGEER